VFLTIRQELKRFQRLGLGYSKKLGMHKLATAMQIGIYNLVRKHSSLDRQTPAMAAGLETERWTLERVVEMTEAYWEIKDADQAEAKRAQDDAAFEAAFAEAGL